MADTGRFRPGRLATWPARCAKRDLTMRMRLISGYLTSIPLLILGGVLAAQEEPAQDQVPRVLVVPIEGSIDSPTVVLTRRALKEAKERGVSRVCALDEVGVMPSSHAAVPSTSGS